ncbi:RUN and FYVE domain-containing protein 2-like isoform X1 [Daphnia carinata]|uniref:RUN and FYVE domain-containing protein 2-like isoform X1 n=1 Tax=Daphnia carinata TaxID=120202 RepID=UPI00257DE986|nr:RUN and FYVE domain-containing protein 2-like isoform X1 [Daphnia carinata]
MYHQDTRSKRNQRALSMISMDSFPCRIKSEMSSINDTIYLCNFRVSVDGDWLCLKELHELQSCEFPSRPPFLREEYERDPAQVERTNLVNLCKLIVKELIDSSVQYGRMLDSDFVPLQHFFIVLEHALRHGLRPKKGILGPKKELWDLLQTVEKSANEACDITASVRDLPTVRTSLGRARAWIRLALMQKKLADYLKVLIDQRDGVLHEYYEPGALLLCDEAVIVLGLLLGLNVVDCNLCLKEEDLDSQQGVIDFSLYLRTGSNNTMNATTDTVDSSSMTAVLDQKNYVEELNRHLSATITNLQTRLDATTTSNTLMKEELTLAKLALAKAQEENTLLKGYVRNERSDSGSQEMEPVNATNNRSSTYMAAEDAIAEVKLQLAEEKNNRLDLEKELELQMNMRAETEVALKLLEKDIHEKQDTIVSLRKQLEDIKVINLEMFRKLQDQEKTANIKNEYVAKLEAEIGENKKNLRLTQEQMDELKLAAKRTEDNVRRSMEENMELQSHCRTLEEDLRLEKEWRSSLQESIVTDRTTMAELQQKLEESHEIRIDYADLEGKHQRLLKLCNDQEKALEEVGVRLRDTKLEADTLKEATVWVPRDAQWAPDEQVTHCGLCNKEFNLARRKHHCRSCGEIFCAACSDQQAQLASSAKPVRVCDTCHTRLLQRYSAAS